MNQSSETKKRISLIEHLHRGWQLANQHADTVRLAVNLSRLCGRKHKAARAANEAAKALNDLRWELENLMWQDFPELPSEAFEVYRPSGGLDSASPEAVDSALDVIQEFFDQASDTDNTVGILDDAILDIISTHAVQNIYRAVEITRQKYNF